MAKTKTNTKRKPVSLPEALRDFMQADGRTIYQLAMDCGVDKGLLGKFMRGERDMRLETAGRVCEALGLELRPVRKGGR